MDVPVLVETLARTSFPMVRCLYLAIEFDGPGSQWGLRLAEQSLPFLMLGLTGVVLAPLSDDRFYGPTLIDELIETVEDADGMILFEDIWLPSDLFNYGVSEGDVYRLGSNLFRHAFRFREGRTLEESYRRMARELHFQMVFSEEETAAFRKWSVDTIERESSGDPKDPSLRLERRREI